MIVTSTSREGASAGVASNHGILDVGAVVVANPTVGRIVGDVNLASIIHDSVAIVTTRQASHLTGPTGARDRGSVNTRERSARGVA